MNFTFKLWPSLVAIFVMVTSFQAKAQTLLPHFATSDQYGGKKVDDMSNFVPILDDYTLEVMGTKGKSISIAFAQVQYTPTQNVKVRFVQTKGKIYVFEGNAYTSTLTPNYKYIEQAGNLLRNGSFETTGTQLNSGRWQASDWDTWNGGTPTWGANIGDVNVRENANYRSDGSKSIILHTSSRWLCQQMTAGALEPNGLYRISCDYWTSDGWNNGNHKYQIWLGSSMAGSDLMTFDAYTTVNNNTSKQSYVSTFQMPSKSIGNVFLSFYRSESGVDWLDNVKLVKLVPSHKGLTGVTSAIFAYGAYAPADMTFPDNVCIDYTNMIVNPNFIDGAMKSGAPAGWTLDAKVTQSKISTGEKGGGVIPSGQNHWQLWQDGSPLNGYAYQTLSNLPNGRYEVSAKVVCTGFSGSIKLFANDGETIIESGVGKVYTVSGVVVNGVLKLGLNFATKNGITIDFDSFTLLYKGKDTAGYRKTLNRRIEDAKEILANLEDGYDVSTLTQLVKNAESLGADASSDQVISAISDIDQELSKYQAYVAECELKRKKVAQFKTVLADAKSERATELYPATADFDKAIAEAESFFGRLENNPTLDATVAQDKLNAARENYYNSQFKVVPTAQVVSSVDLSLNGSEKYLLRVDGKPYYPTEIQVRPDKMRGYLGWSEDEIEATFKRAANDGFNTLSVPLYWSEVEPEKNHFDWHILDRYLGWCKKYGVKMELLWFSWSSGGRIQYLWNVNGKQQLRTPDYVCSLEGTSEFNMLRKEWEYSLDWRDTNLRSRDAYVLGRVMEHIALWDANNGKTHLVIGVQLGNEARAHGDNAATSSEIIDYYHHVGAAVKQSKYVTWTRLNCVSYETSGRTTANENLRNNGGTNIDFVGVDIYGTNANSVKGDLSGYLGTKGKNFRMIMEIDAKDSNSPIYQMAALAGDKAFNYYNLGPVDGNGLYSNSGHVLTERSHINLVRQRNQILNLANQDIAKMKQGSGLYVYNYAGNSTCSQSGLDGISFVPDDQKTQAVAVRHGNEEVFLLSTAGGTFTLPAKYNGYKAQKGYCNANNNWVAEANLTILNGKVVMPETSCVLITKNPRVITGIQSVSSDSEKRIVAYYALSGNKVAHPTKGVYLVKKSDGTVTKLSK